ncbi:hypothetical protein CsSME_00014849 [Camellia sinensis var. sinensis]
MNIDDSFKKPGAIPFKWEIRPGVPKLQQQQPPPSPSYHLQRSLIQHHQQKQQQSTNHHRSSPTTPRKLRPPPAGFNFQPPPPELRTSSFRSAPRTRSDQCRFDRSILVQPETAAIGCFPAPLLRRNDDKKKRRNRKSKLEIDPEPDYTSDLETLSRWSVSTRKSLSPFRDSPLSSSFSFSSYQSSPRPLSDAEWAGFGLF